MNHTQAETHAYTRAVARVTSTKDASIANLTASTQTEDGKMRPGLSYNGAILFLERMEAEGIVSAPDADGKREVLR
jgi:DNA segregation ATPase FtsK/SpoIIIE-like protein